MKAAAGNAHQHHIREYALFDAKAAAGIGWGAQT